MKKYVIKNRTYQPFQLIINNATHIIKAVNEKNSLIVTALTRQMKNMLKKQFITMKEIK